MKHSLFPLILLSLTLTSCSLIRPIDTETTQLTPPTINQPGVPPETVTDTGDNQGDTTSKTPETDKAPTGSKTQTPPTKEIPKEEEVSTEELTKELDAFVDDITKGL